MSKRSKKRKRKLSSSSSEEEEKKFIKHDDPESSKRSRRKQERHAAAEQERSVTSSTPDDPQTSRRIKSPTYRLSKTHAATGQPPGAKAEERTKPRSGHDGKFSDTAKNSEQHKTGGRSRTEERGVSNKSSHTSGRGSSAGKSSLDPKRRPSPRSQVDHNFKEEKTKCRTEGAPRTERERDRRLPVLEDSLKQKRMELVRRKCQRHQGLECKTGSRRSNEAEPPHTSSTHRSPTSRRSPSSVHRAGTPPQNKSRSEQILPSTPTVWREFKIPKKVQPEKNNDTVLTKRNLEPQTGRLDPGVTKREVVQQRHVRPDQRSSFEGADNRSSTLQISPLRDEASAPRCNQVVDELHVARTQKKLEVEVKQSYGELTCMDIEMQEEADTHSNCKHTPTRDLILILDTNILLSHLVYVKKIRSHGLGALGFPLILIPWVVLQELDSLKRGRGLSGSVASLAIPAISYIYNTLKAREPNLWAQSMQQAAASSNSLNAENNDDRVLLCCLQFQSLYPACALILCTNDKNLCSKALLSGVKALTKTDLEEEVERSRQGRPPLGEPPRATSSASASGSGSAAAAPPPPHLRVGAGLPPAPPIVQYPENQQRTGRVKEGEESWDGDRCVSQLGDALRQVLSDVLEVEMKAAYDDLWLEIVYLKPPWTLLGVLQCLKKHWIAVFGQIVPRRKEQTILNLIAFFSSGPTRDRDAVVAALQDAKELVKAFGKSSSLVPRTISTMDAILKRLQPEVRPLAAEEPAACDVVMNEADEEEERRPTPAPLPHQDVWAVFQNIWANTYQLSLEVFQALGFDPHSMQRVQPGLAPPPPQEAVACLHRLAATVAQLLQGFSSVLSSAPSLEKVQSLLGIILSNKIVDVDPGLTAAQFLDCFSQQEYREKLRVGGAQLQGLKEALDHCVGVTGQSVS